MTTKIQSKQLDNGINLHRVSLDGTRAVTALIAFNAGARTERPEENGMAHFLEHLVFKGSKNYPHYRDINVTAERLGAQLNAFTGHDMVAFHITVRAESALPAIELLTDFVARPLIDPEELDRERGVVIQEIARYKDQPSMAAEQLVDTAAFGDHPLGRPVLGPVEHIQSFTRDAILAFRKRRWSGQQGGAFVVGNLQGLRDEAALEELFERFEPLPIPNAAEPAPAFAPQVLVEERDSNQSHLRMIYRPSINVTDLKERAALTIYATLLGGSMGSRLFDEIREQRGLAYSVNAIDHTFSDVSILQLGAGLDCKNTVLAYNRMREIVSELREQGPTEEEVERARAYAAGQLVLSFEDTNAVARYGAYQAIVYEQSIDPELAIKAIDSVTHAEVTEVAKNIEDRLAVACVGPQSTADFQ
jgi:predicted Zn-dependent peptidase